VENRSLIAKRSKLDAKRLNLDCLQFGVIAVNDLILEKGFKFFRLDIFILAWIRKTSSTAPEGRSALGFPDTPEELIRRLSPARRHPHYEKSSALPKFPLASALSRGNPSGVFRSLVFQARDIGKPALAMSRVKQFTLSSLGPSAPSPTTFAYSGTTVVWFAVSTTSFNFWKRSRSASTSVTRFGSVSAVT